MESYDAIIVGSGIGALSCASLLSLHGLKVLVCEAHSKPRGVASGAYAAEAIIGKKNI